MVLRNGGACTLKPSFLGHTSGAQGQPCVVLVDPVTPGSNLGLLHPSRHSSPLSCLPAHCLGFLFLGRIQQVWGFELTKQAPYLLDYCSGPPLGFLGKLLRGRLVTADVVLFPGAREPRLRRATISLLGSHYVLHRNSLLCLTN